MFFVFDSIPDQYITQKMCDEAVNDSLASLKFIPDLVVTNKIIKKLYTALYADEFLLFFDEYSGDVTFCCDEMGILRVNLNNISLVLIIVVVKMILILFFLSDL